MRSSDFNLIPSLSASFDRQLLLEVFRRMCLVHYFELEVIKAVEDKRISYQVYLSLGQESIASSISLLTSKYLIFTQHRCHDKYLAYGGDPKKLRDELLGLPSGTSGGRAGSNCIQCHEKGIDMYGHHGFIGENVPLGVGAALGSGKPVICYFGDGALEEDYVFSAMSIAVSKKLPVLFICEDNNLSILTKIEARRNWSMTKVSESLGMKSVDLADDPWSIYEKVLEFQQSLPAFINIYTCRANWHVGVGTDGPPEWDRFLLVKDNLKNLGFKDQIKNLESQVAKQMERLWKK